MQWCKIRRCSGMTIYFVFSAWSAFSQSAPLGLEPPEHRVLENCPDLSGLMLYQYTRYRPQYVKFEFADICLDPVEPALAGPEPITGLELVQDYGYGTLQYQVVTPGSKNHERTSLSMGPMMSLIDGDDVDLQDAAAIGLQATYFGSAPVQHADADKVSGQGYAYKNLVDEAAFPGGEWLLTFTVLLRKGISEGRVLDHSHLGVHAVAGVTFDGAAPVDVAFISETFLMAAPIKDGQLDLSIKDGEIRGNLSFGFDNTRLPAGRTENEWTTATVEVPFIRGHVTQGSQDIQMHGVGIGRMVTSDDTGRQDIDRLSMSMIGTRLPPGMSAAEYMELQ